VSEGDVMLRQILEVPDDTTARVVYADWLEENGDPGRAQFIRRQCEFSRLQQEGTADRTTMAELQQGQWGGFRDGWLGFRPPETADTGWHNGFIDWVAWPFDFYWHKSRLKRVFSLHPIEKVLIHALWCHEWQGEVPSHLDGMWFFLVGRSQQGMRAVPLDLGKLMPGGEREIATFARLTRVLLYPTESEANAALSIGAVRYARSLAGLPDLPQHRELPASVGSRRLTSRANA